MPRNMSFAMTIDAMRNKSKTVTRRFGWWNLKPGNIVNAVEKSMGIKKGEKIKVIGQIRILATEPTALDEIDKADCTAEGFPNMAPAEFVSMLCDHYKIQSDKICNRIFFEHLGD